MNSQFPPSFIQSSAFLQDVFFDEASNLGCNYETAKKLFDDLPNRIKETQVCKLKVLPSSWRYVFGDNFHIGNQTGFAVPHQMPLVSSLIRACLVARQRLNVSQYNAWVSHIERPAKHYDAITEMVAVANVNLEDGLVYEKRGLGVGGNLIDWLLEKKGKSYLLEVKNRPGQIAEDMERRMTGTKSFHPYDFVPDFEKLFKSTASKFRPSSNSKYIQGAALFLSLKVPRLSIENYFLRSIKEKLHFVAFVGDEGTHVNLIAVSDEIKACVLSAFGWVNDADFFLE